MKSTQENEKSYIRSSYNVLILITRKLKKSVIYFPQKESEKTQNQDLINLFNKKKVKTNKNKKKISHHNF